MSEKNKQTDSHSNDGSDAMIDSLLQQHAQTGQGADEDFLAHMEGVIDAEAKVVPIPRRARTMALLRKSAMIAACIAVLGVVGMMLTPASHEAAMPSSQIVATAEVNDESYSLDGTVMKQAQKAAPAPELALNEILDVSTSSSIRETRYLKLDDISSISMVPMDHDNALFDSVDEFVTKKQREGALFGFQQPENANPKYGSLIDHAWASPLKAPLSTFSIDVDTASWTNVRGMIRRGMNMDQIPADSVRIEEWVNYFDWDYPQPKGEHPFAFATEVAQCPWDTDNLLLRVGIQGEELSRVDRQSANLVFLLDISGSMNQPNKLGYVKKSIAMLTEELDQRDCVSIVVYAGAEGVALEPTKGDDQKQILKTLENLRGGGSTNGGAGIKLAYRFARDNFIDGGINRVILCTDGDFNVGTTSNAALVKLVESQAKDNVFLSVCGFGHDNLNDSMLEEITNKGNGNYFFIDSEREARKVFLEDLMGTLTTIAKDVKIQVEFNPAQIASYRLIGYANRKLKAEDFKNDAVDAGEVGSGHSVTALYELIPVGSKNDPVLAGSSDLRYQEVKDAPERKLIPSEELALLKLRYKRPEETKSIPMQQPIMPSTQSWKKADADFRFAAAVAMVGMKIRDHESVKDISIKDAATIAEGAVGRDIHGYKTEFVDLIKKLQE